MLIVYSYLGYPILLWLISFIYKNHPSYFSNAIQTEINHFRPKVTLLISAYNEENLIDEKIKNSLSLNYPPNLLEIVVVSDGSDDKTNEMVTRYADLGVVLRYYKERKGKTACLNSAIPLAKGDIVIFSDANSHYNKDAISELVKYFTNDKIGFVSGNTKYISEDGDRVLDSLSIYHKIENLTKSLESKIGSCIGADGAIFAIRKNLYVPLKDHDINDLIIPLNIIQQGFCGFFEKNAFCLEKTTGNMDGEFNRQVRITNRTLRAIFNHKKLLNPFKYPFVTFGLISHKLVKFMVPFFLLLIPIMNILLIIETHSIIYYFTFLPQIVFSSLCWLGHKQINPIFLSKLISLCYTFAVVSFAMLIGWFKYFQGETYTTWTTNR